MTQPAYHLVHANLAIARAPLDNPLMAGFVARADEIDALAAGTPGFVTQPTPPDEGTIFKGNELLNLSIWGSVESLRQFAYTGEHARALEHRSEWFAQYEGPNYVLYWVPAGLLPSEAEVKERFDHLASRGPTPYAFDFEQPFTVQEMLAYSAGRP